MSTQVAAVLALGWAGLWECPSSIWGDAGSRGIADPRLGSDRRVGATGNLGSLARERPGAQRVAGRFAPKCALRAQTWEKVAAAAGSGPSSSAVRSHFGQEPRHQTGRSDEQGGARHAVRGAADCARTRLCASGVVLPPRRRLEWPLRLYSPAALAFGAVAATAVAARCCVRFPSPCNGATGAQAPRRAPGKSRQ